jgi:diadenosine tetraphosphate (Ap4A) HIT family hydrolase
MRQTQQLDMDAYVRQCQEGPCFICEMVSGNPGYRHHLVFEDPHTVAFLNRYPTLYGYVLVAPREHREQVTGDFALDEYLALQRVIYCVAEAVQAEVAAERVYILSLGSQQGNRHVHWHVAPLPSGVPYRQQQLEALRMERGFLSLPEEEMASLALRLRCRIDETKGRQP